MYYLLNFFIDFDQKVFSLRSRIMVKIFLILVCIFFVSDGLERLYKQKNACNRMSCRQIFRSTRLESSSDTADKFDMFQQAESRTGLNNNNDEILPDTSTLSAHANEYISSFVQNIKDLQGTPELVDRYPTSIIFHSLHIIFRYLIC